MEGGYLARPYEDVFGGEAEMTSHQISFCKCGCGEVIKWRLQHRRLGNPSWLRGHNNRGGNTLLYTRPDYFVKLINEGIKRAAKERRCKNIFENMNGKDYWLLGLFTSDGCMWKPKSINGHYISFTGDLDVMEKVRNIIGCKNEVMSCGVPGCDTRRLQIGNIDMYNTLLRLGLTPRKSLSLKYPNIPIDYENTKHFIRGIFDGDGCVTLTKNRTAQKRGWKYLNIRSEISSGSKEFLEKTNNILKGFDLNGCLKEYDYNSNMFYRLHFNRTESKKLYHFMYDDVPESHYGNRKKARFEEVMKDCERGFEET